MDAFLIEGLYPLEGEILISGSKNSSLPIMAATLLTDEPVKLYNVPSLADTYTMKKLIGSMNGTVYDTENYVYFENSGDISLTATYDLVKTMRASVLVLGPLIARFNRAKVSFPGGCAIGSRPVDQHLKALERMGVRISIEEGYIIAETEKLKGAKVYFDMPTVGGTENILMAAALADGETIIDNAAMEPEITDLADFLRKMGAKITGDGTPLIKIEGVKKLHGIDYTIIPDRIEAATYALIGAVSGKELVIKNIVTTHIDAVLRKMETANVKFKTEKDKIIIFESNNISSVNIKTQPYPGFPTDVQAQFMSLLTKAEGTSIINENIFENRFMHVSEINRMGAKIRIDGSSAIIDGVKELKGAPVMASDLRASAALVIAALSAKGKTKISRIYHLDRGYEFMEKKLSAVGAKIQRIKE